MGKADIKSMTPEELERFLEGLGQPKYRAGQIFTWLHRGLTSFEGMTDLPKELRGKLEDSCFITVPKVMKKLVSRDKTVKILWELEGGSCVESVLMHYRHGNSVCISSQAGCRMGCRFCASSHLGFDRNLSASELLDQVLFMGKNTGEEINHVVLMGIGEPLENFDNVIRFLRLVNHPKGLGIGMRHISLSTCGVPGGIQRLAGLDLQITLSVSLHAPDDETRSRLMPVNKACGVDRLVSDCRDYYKRTGRRVSFEYAMIKGVNDSAAQAEKLAGLLENTASHINLIPLNRTDRDGLEPSSPESVENFLRILARRGLNATVRRSLGQDIDAACGQLRRKSALRIKG